MSVRAVGGLIGLYLLVWYSGIPAVGSRTGMARTFGFDFLIGVSFCPKLNWKSRGFSGFEKELMLLFDCENYDGVGTYTSIIGLLVAIFFSVPVLLIGFIATGCSSFVSS